MPTDFVITDRFVLFLRGWLSQWFKRPFTIDGITYNCCEQYMMAEKAAVFGDADLHGQILAAISPREQKELGRKVHGFDEQIWKRVCRGIVYHGNMAKFSQNADLAEQLLATSPRMLVEANPRDGIWGIGLTQDDPNALDPAQWQGTNWLGIALMQVRQNLADRAVGKTIVLDAELRKQLDEREELLAAER